MHATVSLAQSLASLPASQRQTILNSLSDADAAVLEYDWRFWARPNQLAPPGDWRTWLICAGRGFGKTRTGAEFVRDHVDRGAAGRIALVGATAADARDVMIEGESGLLSIFPPWQRPVYEPSKRRITFHNGATATAYSADEPERLRGPQHDLAWSDELGAWRYPEAWDQLQFGLRLGTRPRNVVTTTPRPTDLFKKIRFDKRTVTTFGATRDNLVNLAQDFIDDIYAKYSGTRLGKQELDGELLTDVPGALWTWAMIEAARWRDIQHPELRQVVISMDPATTSGEDADEWGITACGAGVDGRGYLLADRSKVYTPDQAARTGVDLLRQLDGNYIVAEKNQGGEMITSIIRNADPHVKVKLVHASRGKHTRAEPVSMLYEQGRISHVGVYPQLESELTSWVPGITERSPNRLDALVWGFTELFIKPVGVPSVVRLN